MGYLEILSILMFVVMVAFDAMLVMLVTRNITSLFMSWLMAADKVSEGKLDETPRSKVHGKDEVGVVTVAFNQMVSSIPDILQD